MQQRPPHGLQVPQARFDIRQPCLGQCPGFGAGACSEFQQVADFSESESEFLSAFDKAQRRKRRGRVTAYTAQRFTRCIDEPAPLVIAHGLDVDAGGARQGADGHVLHDAAARGAQKTDPAFGGTASRSTLSPSMAGG